MDTDSNNPIDEKNFASNDEEDKDGDDHLDDEELNEESESNDDNDPNDDPDHQETSTSSKKNPRKSKIKNKKKKENLLKILKPKSNKRGIIYLNYIPEGITVKNIRQLLSKYGEIERIYLEKDSTLKKNKRSRKFLRYTEGWIEFKKKSVAKMVAELLNGKPVGGKRHTKYYDSLWNMKYLKRFKWSHLTEQMAYEKALRDSKLRLEIGQAKKEATFYSDMINRNLNKKQIYNDSNRIYKQRFTEEQIKQLKLQKNNGEQQKNPDELDDELLEKIFK